MIHSMDTTTHDELVKLADMVIEAHLTMLIFIPDVGIFYHFKMGMN